MPWTVEPRVAVSSNSFASGVAGPEASKTWARGMASVSVTACAAGSHSQYPTWSWNVSTSPGCVMWRW
jgi:hypothetical protein